MFNDLFLMGFCYNFFIQDIGLPRHQQARVSKNSVSKFSILNIIALKIKPETFAFNPSPVGKKYLKIQLYPFIHLPYRLN